MRTDDLRPRWAVAYPDRDTYRILVDWAQPPLWHGVALACPGCVAARGDWRGCPHLLLWQPGVPDDWYCRPGRWAMHGGGFSDLTLVGSVLSTHCGHHFFIEVGVARIL